MDVTPLTFSHAEFQPQLGRSVSIEQAAQLLGVSRRTVYYRIRDGRLRTIRTIGGSQRVLMDSVEELRGAAN
jgi:excisionase family DNA binding protein